MNSKRNERNEAIFGYAYLLYHLSNYFSNILCGPSRTWKCLDWSERILNIPVSCGPGGSPLVVPRASTLNMNLACLENAKQPIRLRWLRTETGKGTAARRHLLFLSLKLPNSDLRCLIKFQTPLVDFRTSKWILRGPWPVKSMSRWVGKGRLKVERDV